jgi:hypothetical protein
MTVARGQQIDASVTRWYHRVTRCVRRAFLLGEGTPDRKVWIESRIEELAQIFFTVTRRIEIGFTTDAFELSMVRSCGYCACRFRSQSSDHRPVEEPAEGEEACHTDAQQGYRGRLGNRRQRLLEAETRVLDNGAGGADNLGEIRSRLVDS